MNPDNPRPPASQSPADVPPSVRSLVAADLPAAQRWVEQAGWNQTPGDWLRLLHYQPDGCFVAVRDGQPVGSVTTTRYGTRLGWIGMMLVDPDYRRRGVATMLMQRSIDFLDASGVAWIQLDATAAGQPVYERLGFQPQWSFHRWQRASDRPPATWPPARVPCGDALRVHAALDREAFGADRMQWLLQLAEDSVVVADDGGLAMLRPGRLAAYLGPVTARDAQAAERIIGQLVQQVPGPIYWDIPGPNVAAQQLARALGFQPVRSLLRMASGRALAPPRVELQFAIADPATG